MSAAISIAVGWAGAVSGHNAVRNVIRNTVLFILHIVFCKDTTFSERRRETMFHKQEYMFNPAVFFDDETFFLLSET